MEKFPSNHYHLISIIQSSDSCMIVEARKLEMLCLSLAWTKCFHVIEKWRGTVSPWKASQICDWDDKKKKKLDVCLSRKIFISSHISEQKKRVWVFIGMITACGDSPIVNSSLMFKSNINVMGGRLYDCPERWPSESLLENMEIIKSTLRVISWHINVCDPSKLVPKIINNFSLWKWGTSAP